MTHRKSHEHLGMLGKPYKSSEALPMTWNGVAWPPAYTSKHLAMQASLDNMDLPHGALLWSVEDCSSFMKSAVG
jgi:hypothetical protein